MSVIFSYNLESGDLTGLTLVGSSDLSVSDSAALASSSYGVSLLLDDTTANYVYNTDYASHNHTGGRFRVRFYIDPNSATWASGEAISVFGLRGGGVYKCLIQLVRTGTTYYIQAYLYNDAGSSVGLSSYSITDAPHYVEIDLIRATNSTSNDGSMQLWIDGVSKENYTGVDNYDRMAAVGSFYWGGITKPSSPSGTVFLDELIVNDDGTLIGPRSTAFNAAAVITGRATVAATGTSTTGSTAHSGAAVISARATLAASGRSVKNAQMAINAGANLSAAVAFQVDDVTLEWVEYLATLSGQSNLSGTGKITANAQAAISGDATLIGTGRVNRNAQATIAGDANLIGTGKVTKNAASVIVGDANLVGTGKVTNNARTTITATASVIATGTVTSVSGTNWSGVSTISARANLSATATKSGSQLGQATISGDAELTATGRVTKNARTTITGDADLIATGQVVKNASAVITGDAELTATGLITAQAQARIVAAASLIATASIDRGGQALLIARAALIATATHTVFTQSPLVLHVAGRDLTLHAPERSLIMTPGERP